MKSHIISFNQDGTAQCLWTEAVPLHSIGKLDITRATTIEFNNNNQQWEVQDPQGKLLFSDPLRSTCLDWEHQYFNQ